jgi:phage-related minor tail protein
MENLIIEIGANTREFIAGLSEVGEKTESLNDKIKGVGVAAGVAFAGYAASIMGAVYAYREEEKIGQEVEAILKSTGGVAGVTAKAVEEYAASLSKATTFSKESVARGEEILLTYTRIGKDVFPNAAAATLDLAQRMGGDASGAAQILGRALEDPTNGVKKL